MAPQRIGDAYDRPPQSRPVLGRRSAMAEPIALTIGDVVELRKAHPCGGRLWRVLRVGLDIGVECLTCQRYVLVPRRRFERDIKRFVERANDSERADPNRGGENRDTLEAEAAIGEATR